MNRNISHIEIPAAQRAELADFYTALFGWETEPMDDKGSKYTVWQSGNLRGGFPEMDEDNSAGNVVVYLESEDIDADLANIEAKGGKTVKGKTEYPAGWFAYFTDPTGNRLGLMQKRG
jgi:predicted enzyme related to lactoylglutathione lyase